MVTTKIVLDDRRKSSDEKYYIKLRVTQNRISKYYSANNKKFSKEEFERIINAKRKTIEEKTIHDVLQSVHSKANDCIRQIKFFTFYAFEEVFFENRGALDLIDQAFDRRIMELKEEERIGTAGSYECAKNSLVAFKSGICFADINPKFLNKYEKWMLSKDNSYTTVGIYLRNLRALFKEAIRDKIIDQSLYPFGLAKNGLYEIPSGRNIKKALPINEISLLYYYETNKLNRATARDFWKFSYLCNGLNVKDILNLRQKNIGQDFIYYTREKTKRTKKTAEPIVIPLKPDTRVILKTYGVNSNNPDDFVFPVYNQEMSAEKRFKEAYNFTRFINKNLHKICTEIGISSEITTYSARHSFATVLKRNNTSMELIQELLGHQDLKTTKNYLDSFENETIKSATDVLIPQRPTSENTAII